jgi:hypothetical protein
LKVWSIRWSGGLLAGNIFEGHFISVFISCYALHLSMGTGIPKDGKGAEKDE